MSYYDWYEYPNTPFGNSSEAIGSGYYRNNYGRDYINSLVPQSYQSEQVVPQSDLYQQSSSGFNDYVGGEDSTSPEAYTAEDLVNNPSPAWMGTLNDLVWNNVFVPGANMAFPGGGAVLDMAKNSATNPSYGWKEALLSIPSALLNIFNPGSRVSQLVDNPYGKMATQYGVNKFSQTLLGGALNSLFGTPNPYQDQRNWLERALDSLTGKYSPDDPTIGNPVTDPFLAVGPGTENYDGTNMLGDPNNDPFGATPSDFGGSSDAGGGWGGPDGSWSGDAWGDSYY